MVAFKARRIIAILIVFALFAGASLHATIPHHHSSGHAHNHPGETEDISIIWQGLHVALRHEDKKFTLAANVSMLPLVFDNSLLSAMEIVAIIALAAYGVRRTDSLLEMLRRGLVPYRKFR